MPASLPDLFSALQAAASHPADTPIGQQYERAARALERLHSLVHEEDIKRAAEQARTRLAQLDEEREKLIAKLGATPTQQKRKRKPPTPRTPITHGSTGGANQHRYRGEDPCDWCRTVELANLAAARALLAEKRARA